MTMSPPIVPQPPEMPPVTVRIRGEDGRLVYCTVVDRDNGRVKLREAASGALRWVDAVEIVEAE